MKELDKIHNKIISFDNIEKQVLKWREENKKIVFTNGCFDIIHRGHVDYLSKAKDLGDILIIGLNTDLSVRNIKGNTRPIQDENSRAIILASMQFVDAIVFFSEPTPYTLIKEIQPDILVKGADYKKEDIVGYDIVSQRGGKVETIEFIEGYSTSNIERKIKNAN
ncbi:MAG: D-glycero-beta-D-manno-heptose 1-phosphate adenylyltransferase [Bacteroidales bacterium]|jgi:rfaE bifunctional protein nucleotidyltransferase chain/domain|nr:D-glycero-beta-D-manno-heptose 1-phosphate adenylyltransferase [Bacteroidales bacterium]MDD4703581.1 D-glycero-beta-D-manno-heptose 1-phosphate adenylyltransferase [Bacteroidales bacterium]